MKRALLLIVILVAAACSSDPSTGPSGQPVGFFVTSTTSVTGNLGGLGGADFTCQRLAGAAGFRGRAWRAYLSVEHDSANGNGPTNARDRIGTGPWYNVNGILVANNLAELHSRRGDAAVFVDERGRRINGQWPGSPSPNEHDILTGSTAEGTVIPGETCGDWTSEAATGVSRRVGHSDGFGGGGSTTVTPTNNVVSWNSAHTSAGCANTAPGGGAGRFYCFAR
jgi:hypothetical protein